jgi:hypothetical protein
MRIILGILLMLTIAGGARADTTAGKLAAICEHSASTLGDLKSADSSDGFCTGIIVGYRNVIDYFPVLSKDRHSELRINHSASNSQLIRVFYKFVKAHPKLENENALLAFILALRDAGLGGWNVNQPEAK